MGSNPTRRITDLKSETQNDTFFSRENATQNKVTFSTAAVKKYTHEWCSWWFISFHSLSRSNGHLDTKWFSRFKNQMNSGVVGNKNGF